MTRAGVRIALFTAAWIAVGFRGASAQRRVTVEPAGPGTIVGIVADSNGRVLDSAEVYLVSTKHRVIAENGRFRFDSLKSGKYTVAARRVGYYPGGREVTLGPEGVAVIIAMTPIGRTLPTIVTSASRGGLSGVIGDTAYNVIAGARVQVVASSRRAVSDSAGLFYIDVPPGKHMVSVKREGFASKLVSVTVPPDSGRRMLVWLAPQTPGAENREAAAVAELANRIMRRNVVYSSLQTREDINKSGLTELTQLAQKGSTRPMSDTCSAIIDGGPLRIPLWLLKAADVEMVEVYESCPARYAVANARTGGNARRPPPRDCETVFVWLRK